MESSELDLSEEELSAIVQRIVETRATDEPFSSQEDFWKQGFHKRAFCWLHQDIKFAMRKRMAKPFEGPVYDFQRRLNCDIDKVGEAIVSNPVQLEAFAKSGRWCDYRHLRKAVLTLLYKHSFPYLAAPINIHHDGRLKYPKWLKGEWIQSVTT